MKSVSGNECTLNWVVKPPSDFLFLLSIITEQITLLWDSVYTEVMLKSCTRLFHLPVPSVAANCLCCDANALVCLISFIFPQKIFLLFEYLKTASRKSFSVSMLITACVETLKGFSIYNICLFLFLYFYFTSELVIPVNKLVL